MRDDLNDDQPVEKNKIPARETNFLNRQLKLDLEKLSLPIAQTLLMYAVDAKAEAVFKTSLGILGALSFKKGKADKNANLAYQLLLNAFIKTFESLVERNKHLLEFHFKGLEEDHSKLKKLINKAKDKLFPEVIQELSHYQTFQKKLKIILEQFLELKDWRISFETLKNPEQDPIVKPLQAYFRAFLEGFGASENDAKHLANHLPTHFTLALHQEWAKNYDEYQGLKEQLDIPTHKAAKRVIEWEEYYSYLRAEIVQPVFNESFTLKDIYVPLRAAIQPNRTNVDFYGQNSAVKREVVWLRESIDEWLGTNDKNNAIKVIQGGPGSGKSSFLKQWTEKLVKERNYTVLFFALHRYRINKSFEETIRNYFKRKIDLPIAFDPLEDKRTFDDLILIFDGLDELAIQGKTSKETVDIFIQELKDFCQDRNEDKLRVRALITARPVAGQYANDQLLNQDEEVLFLLPYHMDDAKKEAYHDPQGLLNKDQRNLWWRKFAALKGFEQTGLPGGLRIKNLDHITAEPLLNYLVALAWDKGEEDFSKDLTNINVLYKKLIDRVYVRDWEKNRKHKGIEKLSEAKFNQLLELIALSAWQGGEARITTIGQVKKQLKKDKELSKAFQTYNSNIDAGFSRLLMAFYFRKQGKKYEAHDDNTFEFTHKRFGEYLAARAFVRLIETIVVNYSTNGWNEEKCLEAWSFSTGGHPLNGDLNQLILNELQLKKKAGVAIEEWQKVLAALVKYCIHHQMPVPNKNNKENNDLLSRNYMPAYKWGRNAEETLIVAFVNCSRVTEVVIDIRWSEEIFISLWLGRLSTSLQNDDFIFKNLSHLNLSNAYLSDVNLRSSDLKFSDLRYADLSDVNLRFSDLSSVDLRFADLRYSDLSNTILTSADLRNASLVSANLKDANLSNADLKNTDLRDINLRSADLSNTSLRAANLRGANLLGVDLRDADLTGVIGLTYEDYLLLVCSIRQEVFLSIF